VSGKSEMCVCKNRRPPEMNEANYQVAAIPNSYYNICPVILASSCPMMKRYLQWQNWKTE